MVPTNLCSSLALFKGSSSYTFREGELFLLSCLVHVFIVVALPEMDLKVAAAALGLDRVSSAANTAVP